jgi:hypothetical protein
MVMFKQVAFTKLKRNQKYLCDDGFNSYIGIFKRYYNQYALFENTKDITILDTIIKKDLTEIKYNKYSKYFSFYKYMSLLLFIPSIGNYHPYLLYFSSINYLTYIGITLYEIERGRRFMFRNSNYEISKFILLVGGPFMNCVFNSGIFIEFTINCFVYFYIRYICVIEYAPKDTSFYVMHKTKQLEMERRVFNKIMYSLFGHEIVGKYL